MTVSFAPKSGICLEDLWVRCCSLLLSKISSKSDCCCQTKVQSTNQEKRRSWFLLIDREATVWCPLLVVGVLWQRRIESDLCPQTTAQTERNYGIGSAASTRLTVASYFFGQCQCSERPPSTIVSISYDWSVVVTKRHHVV